DFVPDGWTFCSNVMSRVHMPWSRGSCEPTPVELAAKLRPEMREHVANMKPLS
ncbi:unnamed protein product, partial [Ascophyllum nodosum]